MIENYMKAFYESRLNLKTWRKRRRRTSGELQTNHHSLIVYNDEVGVNDFLWKISASTSSMSSRQDCFLCQDNKGTRQDLENMVSIVFD